MIVLLLNSNSVLCLPAGATLALSEDTPSVTAPAQSSPTAASVVTAGAEPVVGLAAVPSAASLSLSGATSSVTAPAQAAPAARALSVTGATPTIAVATVAAPASVNLSVVGGTPIVTAPAQALPSEASLATAGEASSVITTQSVVSTPDGAPLVTSGGVPVVSGGDVVESPVARGSYRRPQPLRVVPRPVSVRPHGSLVVIDCRRPRVDINDDELVIYYLEVA